jgi:hypothetical protein
VAVSNIVIADTEKRAAESAAEGDHDNTTVAYTFSAQQRRGIAVFLAHADSLLLACAI